MHVGVVADKTNSLYGLQLEALLTHLLSLPDVSVSIHEKLQGILNFNSHEKLHFVDDFSGVLCDSYILYGIGAAELIKGLKGNVCYIPDPDFTSPFLQLHEELESRKEQFKVIYPLGSYFSLFSEDLGLQFSYLKIQSSQKDTQIFDLCIIVDETYEKTFKLFDFLSKNIMIVYIGTDNKALEDAVEKLWDLNSNISLSTFQEPVSFFHTRLAKEIMVACDIAQPKIICQILRDMRFNLSVCNTTNSDLAKFPVFSLI
jgi:hypothetical protein